MNLHTKVLFRTECGPLQTLFDAAEEVCRGNLRMFGARQVLVEGGGYEKIWLETQPMGGGMYAKRNLTAARNNVELFMENQREDGRLPGSIEHMGNGRLEAQFNKLQGFCFASHGLEMYYWLSEGKEYLYRLKNCLEAFDRYLWQWRDTDGDGILESFCVYDTGEDNALRYADSPVYCQTDLPPGGCSVVPMGSMDITSFSYACRDTLRQISLLIGDGEERKWENAARQVADNLKKRLWNEERSALFDRDVRGQSMPTLIHNTLRCMYWGSVSPEMAQCFVKKHLLNPEEFWTKLPLPSVAANDPLFRNEPENNWSGQCEGLSYQRSIQALERYQMEPVVTALGHRLIDAVIRSGYVFSQQYDPFTGQSSRVSSITKKPLQPGSSDPFQRDYGPTALAVLEFIAHIWGVDMQMGRLRFSLGSGIVCSYEQQWGDRSWRIESDGKNAAILLDGRKLLRSPCGVCLITDMDGNLMEQRNIEPVQMMQKE